jgi:hypothetical protein
MTFIASTAGIASLVGAGGAITGGLLGSRKSSSSQTPQIDPKYQGLVDALYGKYMDNLNSSTDLTGYEGTGLSNINSAYDLAKLTRQNALTRRGLSTSPVAAAMDTNALNAKSGTVSAFENSLPLLERELKQQDYSNAQDLIGTLMGQQQTSQSGTGLGSGLSSVGSLFGWLLGQGAFGDKSGDSTYKGGW